MKGVAWTLPELDRLVLLRSHGLTWGQIAGKMRGRTAAACNVAHFSIKARRLCAEAREKAQVLAQHDLIARRETWYAEAAKKPTPPSLAEVSRRSRLASQVAAPPDATREQGCGAAMSTARLVQDAELRARIEILGPTGGMLGDPLPGRSALHKPRAKEWCGS